MDEFLLEEERWPAPLEAAPRGILRGVIAGFRAVKEVLGLAAGGSFASGRMDEFSDLDLVVVVGPSAGADIKGRRQALAASLGPLLASFTGEHVGEPRLLICLYGPPLVHVDLKFVTPDELGSRVEDPVVLWDRGGQVRAALAAGHAAYPRPDLQWIEDRFWIWVHYAAAKIGRGELFEALDFTAFLRENVFGPLSLQEASARPQGVRQMERAAPARAEQMRHTVARYEARDLIRALRAAITMYRGLRPPTSAAALRPRAEAEAAALEYLDTIARRVESAPPDR
jgi:hypothetical protein